MENNSVVLTSIVAEQELRGVAHQFPDGPVEGYEWRLRVTYPANKTQPARSEWLPWVFGSSQVVQQMLSQWREFVATKGHKGDRIRLVKSYECRSINLPVQGRIERVTDLAFQAQVRGGGDEQEESPIYRMDLATLRQLALSVADAIAIAEGRNPPSTIGEPRH